RCRMATQARHPAVPAPGAAGGILLRNLYTLLVPSTWTAFPYLCPPHFELRHKNTQNNTKQKHKLIIIL
ncbi:TPA: hypothetical protein ACIVCH_002705, partial [Salmonella enterica subsp. enterica serovar Monschaui]